MLVGLGLGLAAAFTGVALLHTLRPPRVEPLVAVAGYYFCVVLAATIGALLGGGCWP